MCNILRCTILWFLVYLLCCTGHHHLIPEYSITPKRSPIPIISHSHPPPSPTTTNPPSVSVDLPVLDVSHQWNQTLLCLASLTELRVLEVVSARHPFSWLTFQCVEGPCFGFLLCGWWAFGLLPLFGCCGLCRCEHACADSRARCILETDEGLDGGGVRREDLGAAGLLA